MTRVHDRKSLICSKSIQQISNFSVKLVLQERKLKEKTEKKILGRNSGKKIY